VYSSFPNGRSHTPCRASSAWGKVSCGSSGGSAGPLGAGPTPYPSTSRRPWTRRGGVTYAASSASAHLCVRHVDRLPHLDNPYGAERPHVGYRGRRAARLKLCGELRVDGADTIAPCASRNQIERGGCDGARQRVGHESWPVHKGHGRCGRWAAGRAVGDGTRGERRTECHVAASKRLTHAHDVRDDASMLARKELTYERGAAGRCGVGVPKEGEAGHSRACPLACATEACGDLIEDEKCARLVTQPSHLAQVVGRVEVHAARALDDWLEDHRRNVLPVRAHH